MDVKSCVVTYVNIVVVFAPGAKMAAIAGDDAAQTIFPTGITGVPVILFPSPCSIFIFIPSFRVLYQTNYLPED